jgi:hypothetical protein
MFTTLGPPRFVEINTAGYETPGAAAFQREQEREAMTEIRTAQRAAAITRNYPDRRPSEPERAPAAKPDFWQMVDAQAR